MLYLLMAIFPAALIVAAINDVYEFKIPNLVSAIIIAGFPVCLIAAGGSFTLLWQGLLVGAIVLVVGFGLFAFRVVGGGDAKLLAASAPWFGTGLIDEFLLLTGIFGGFLALLILIFRGMPMLPIYARYTWLFDLYQSKTKGIPYGVAIAGAGIICYLDSPLFQLVFHH